MSLVFCTPGSLIGGRGWYPAEPFDYNWDAFGCNRLKCGICSQWVLSTIGADPDARSYSCACQQHVAFGYHLIGSDEGQIHEFRTAWACGGHPELVLPANLDGVAVPADGDFGTIVGAALSAPPFVPPGVKSPSFWVQRLYRLVRTDALRRAVGEAVAAQIQSGDPTTVRAALDFFAHVPDAPGVERLAPTIARDRARLASMRDPQSSNMNLYERALDAIEMRLGGDDTAAIAVAQAALLDGTASSGILFLVARHEREWFANHAAEIVRAAPDRLDFVLEAAKDLPVSDRARVLRNLQRMGIDERDVVRRFAGSFGEPDRGVLLRELDRD